jgi:serine O-acetyltransferase
MHGDLTALARHLLTLAAPDRPKACARLMAQADAADRYRKRMGRAHPLWGNGTLMARALGLPHQPEPRLQNPDYASCLILALTTLTQRPPQNPRPLTALRLASPPEMVYHRSKEDKAMSKIQTKLAQIDPVWNRILTEAEQAVKDEPMLGGLIHSSVLHHGSIECALAYRIALKLGSGEMSEQLIREICDEAYGADPALALSARADIMAVYDRDPACHRFLQPLLFFKGFQAVQAYRVAHWLWTTGRQDLAYFFQMRVSETFGVDIHPAARIGKGIMIDHAHSIVIGETAVVGDNVSMLHSVTLGGTGKEEEDRHPKIGEGVLIGAGAKVLGNIHIGHCSRIAAGSVVLHDVPPKTTVAGVPAKVVGEAGCATPSITMDQLLRESL